MTENVDEQPALESAQAEVATEEESPDGSLAIELRTSVGNADITVPPSEDWDAEAIDMLDRHRFTGWAQLVLSEKDWATWQNLRPTLREANDFFKRWSEDSGQDTGKSRPSSRALRRMRRR